MSQPIRILVAGIGNIFLGDDGFGVEVVRHLLSEEMPDGVEVRDYGIRGVHLAFELLAPIERLIIVDAASRGGAPGTLYAIEPSFDGGPSHGNAHGMDLPSVFASVRAMGGTLPSTVLVGCEPGDLQEGIGLSAMVRAAVPIASRWISALVRDEEWLWEPEQRGEGPWEGRGDG